MVTKPEFRQLLQDVLEHALRVNDLLVISEATYNNLLEKFDELDTVYDTNIADQLRSLDNMDQNSQKDQSDAENQEKNERSLADSTPTRPSYIGEDDVLKDALKTPEQAAHKNDENQPDSNERDADKENEVEKVPQDVEVENDKENESDLISSDQSQEDDREVDSEMDVQSSAEQQESDQLSAQNTAAGINDLFDKQAQQTANSDIAPTSGSDQLPYGNDESKDSKQSQPDNDEDDDQHDDPIHNL